MGNQLRFRIQDKLLNAVVRNSAKVYEVILSEKKLN